MSNDVLVLQDSTDQPARLARQPRLRVGLAGGNQAQRAAVKDVIIHVREVETEIVDLGDARPASEIDPKIGLLAVVLDPADSTVWPMALHPPSSNGLSPVTIALFAERSPQVIQAALRAGADDALCLPPSYEDALRALLRASEVRRRAEGPDQKKICSLVSVSGGRGTSSLTVCLGFALMNLLEKRTALVDLDLQAAPLSVLLDVEPEHTIADLTDPTSPIDSIRLESVLTKHEAGPSLLAAPKRIEQTELVSAATVEAATKVLHDLFDVVLVDCGSHLNESSVVVFEQSDYLLYVLDQTIAAVRAAQRFLNLYESLELRKHQPQLIVIRYRPGDVVTLERIEAALHLPIFATVPQDDAAFQQMQAMGSSLWKISSGASLRRSIEGLTRKLFTAAPQKATKPRLFSRFFGTGG
jgi:pilus assembly protein CpaE